MAEEQQQHQERTEQPTAKRLRDARRRGQVARSRELTMTVVMVVAAVLVYLSGTWFVRSVAGMVADGLSIGSAQARDSQAILTRLSASTLDGLSALAPLLILLPVAAILGGVVLGGWAFSAEALSPKLSKLNPVTGLKRVFGTHGLVEMLKAIGKAGVVSLCALGVFLIVGPRILALGSAPLPGSLASAGQIIATTLLVCSASLALIALVDVPYQLWSHNKKLRMTRKEVQDEMKETEGRPEVRSRIRAMQQELANRRMLVEVPGADVVVTNPSHYAVALKYDESSMNAPVVVAKGVDHMAARIRKIASENGVPLFQSPILARSLHATTRLDQEIDPRLYVAVAQVLTYIYRLRAAEMNRGAWPDRPAIDLSEELTRNGRFSGERDEDESTLH